MNTLQLGDLTVVGEPPPKLAKALAVIATMHDEFGKYHPEFKASLSTKRCCILASLTVRDFLFRLGYVDAEVAPCLFSVRAIRSGVLLHSLGVGDTDHRTAANPENRRTGWPGHMVTILPKTGWLIDTTLFQAVRPQWPNLPGMFATELMDIEDRPFQLKPLSGVSMKDTGAEVDAMWLHQPKNMYWRDAPDARRRRRDPMVRAMLKAFGKWEGTDYGAKAGN